MKQGNKDTISKVDFERWKMEHASNLAQYDAENACSLEMFKSVIQFGQGALKSAIIINGGAAVALLAFVGATWNNSVDSAITKALLISLIIFVIGVFWGAVATGLTYLTQYAYANEKSEAGTLLRWVTICIVIISYIFFLLASAIAVWAFWSHLPGIPSRPG